MLNFLYELLEEVLKFELKTLVKHFWFFITLHLKSFQYDRSTELAFICGEFEWGKTEKKTAQNASNSLVGKIS